MQNPGPHSKPSKLVRIHIFKRSPRRCICTLKFEDQSSGINLPGIYILVDSGSATVRSLGLWAKYLLILWWLDVTLNSPSHLILTSVSACFPLKGRRTQWSARANKRQVEWKLGGLTFSAIEHWKESIRELAECFQYIRSISVQREWFLD